jgi:hypothetical protein
MTRRSALLALLVLAGPALAPAQGAPPKPKPGPEHERLGFLVGKWKGEAELKQNPFMPAGKMTSSDTCEWLPGRFAVVCRYDGKGPMGSTKGLGILSYSTEEKAYTYYGVDSSGMIMATVSKGTWDNGTWTYTDESKMGGKTVKSRYTIRQTSPTAYTFTWEMQGDDGTWLKLQEGTSRKVK